MADGTPLENNQHESSSHGDVLLGELRGGWHPLPFRAVVSLVLAGLKVRLSRSLVTMITVILAITFLTYTGLTGKVNVNLARTAVMLTETPGVPPSEVRAALSALSAVDLAGNLEGPASSWLAVWVSEPSGEIAQRLEELRSLPIMEMEEEERLLNRLQLRTWLEENDPELDGVAAADIAHTTFREEADRMLTAFRNPSLWSDLQMERAELLSDLAVKAGHPSAEVLVRVIRDEKAKREGVRLSSLLRRAGINIEATLSDNFMDTWIIFMALLLCAVGIANAMLMSVTERFREIGTMKCLGAQDGLVVKLFLLESAFLGVAGALLGIVVGLFVALLGAFLQFGGFGIVGFPFLQGIDVLVYALLAGVVLALAGTLYPALLASRMKPVDALRIDE